VKNERRRIKSAAAGKTEHGNAGRPEKIIFTDWVGRSSAPMTTDRRIAHALASYSRTPGALERSKRLDTLILKPRDQEAKPTLTGGDLHRQQLPVGYNRPIIPYLNEVERRAAELAPLVEAVEAIYDDLPDLVTVQDVADKLDPALIERLKGRWPLAVAARLKKLGAVHLDAGNTSDGTRTHLYIVHDPERYEGVRGRRLYAAYQAAKAGQRVQRPRAVSGRSSKARSRGDTPGGRTTPRRPFVGQSDQTKNKIASFGAGHG